VSCKAKPKHQCPGILAAVQKKKKKRQNLKAANWVDNSSCCNERFMQIPPSSWIPFGTRQMVHPPNYDSTNFTERRFSQDSEHKWIDGKIAAHSSMSVPQAEHWLVWIWTWLVRWFVFPADPGTQSCKASSLSVSFWDLFNLSAFLELSDKEVCPPPCHSLIQGLLSDSTEIPG
jgi:hypothetical protein